MESDYTTIILVTFFGFVAAILLTPVYLFLKREERVSKDWTRDELSRRLRDRPPSTNGDRPPRPSDATSSDSG